jgi:hypothetical protein
MTYLQRELQNLRKILRLRPTTPGIDIASYTTRT